MWCINFLQSSILKTTSKIIIFFVAWANGHDCIMVIWWQTLPDKWSFSLFLILLLLVLMVTAGGSGNGCGPSLILFHESIGTKTIVAYRHNHVLLAQIKRIRSNLKVMINVILSLGIPPCTGSEVHKISG